PFALLIGIVRIAGRALANWKRARIMGPGYEQIDVPGRRATYEVHIAAKRGRPEAVSAAATIDALFDRLCAESGFGLAPPQGELKVLLFERRADFDLYTGVNIGKVLERNGGYYSPATREIC